MQIVITRQCCGTPWAVTLFAKSTQTSRHPTPSVNCGVSDQKMTQSDEYEELLHLFIDLVQSQAGNKILEGDGWMNDAQTLSIKLFRHLVSMQIISAGSTIERQGTPIVYFIDHASVKVMTRAALETYLVFYYIFGSQNQSLSKFRHSTWVLGGLTDRQLSHVTTDENRAVLFKEKGQIEELKQEISKSHFFSKYTKNQQGQLLKGKWRVGNGWSDLGVAAGFHKKYFDNIYSYLCGYSHSSYISAMQVGQAQSIEDQESLTNSIMGIGIVIMAHYAFSYSRSFESAKEVLNKSNTAKVIAEKWHFGPEDLAAIYDR